MRPLIIIALLLVQGCSYHAPTSRMLYQGARQPGFDVEVVAVDRHYGNSCNKIVDRAYTWGQLETVNSRLYVRVPRGWARMQYVSTLKARRWGDFCAILDIDDRIEDGDHTLVGVYSRSRWRGNR